MGDEEGLGGGGVGEERFWLKFLCVCRREKTVGLTYVMFSIDIAHTTYCFASSQSFH